MKSNEDDLISPWDIENDIVRWGIHADQYVDDMQSLVKIIFKRTDVNISIMWVISLRASSVRVYPSMNKYYLAMKYTEYTPTSTCTCTLCGDAATLHNDQTHLCRKCLIEVYSIHENAIDVNPTFMYCSGSIIDVVVESDSIVYFFHRISVAVSDFHYPNIIQCKETPRCQMCAALAEICGRFASSAGKRVFIDANWKKVALFKCTYAHHDVVKLIIQLFIRCMSG